MPEHKDLVCPECGYRSFSYIVREVSFASVYLTEEGERRFHHHERGEIIGDDVAENGIQCGECLTELRKEDLVTEKSNEPKNNAGQ